MLTNRGLQDDPLISLKPISSTSPVKILAVLAASIFLSEIVAMVVLYFVELPTYLATTLLDASIMLVLILPALYFLQVRPLWKQMGERSRAESALRSSEGLLKKILELLPVGVWIIDESGNIVHGNPAGQKIWGGARYVDIPHYVEYKAWWADSGKPVQPEEWAAARCIALKESVLDQEMNIETFDGTPKVILNSAVPMMDEQNNVQGVVVLNQDITSRRLMEKSLIQTNELLEKTFFSIDTLIAYMDKNFNFVRVNDTYAKAAGHPAEFLIGKNHFDLYPNEENQVIFKQVVETGQPFTVLEKPFEYAEYPELGVTYWDWSCQPVKGDHEAVEGVVLSLVDVTERKRAQIQLARQNEELLELSKAEHRQRELAESLVQASIVLNTSLELDQVLRVILEQIRKRVPFRGANILFLEENYLRVVSYVGFEGMPEESPALGKSYLLEDFPLHKQICESLQPVNIDSVAENPDWRWMPGLEWIRSYLGVPLLYNKEVIGIISLNSEREGAFTQEAVDHLLAFTAPAALALHNARLFAAESTARQVAETLATAAHALTKSLDLEQVFNTLLDHIKMIVNSDTAGVNLFEDETHLVTRSLRGYGPWSDQENIPAFPIDVVTDLVIHRIFSERKSLVLPNSSSYSLQIEQPGCEPICNWLIVPIIASNKFIGLVELGRVKDVDFSPEHIQWAEALVGQAAVAIQNARLFQQVSSSSDQLQSLTRKLVEVQENERFHIARELHDEAGQALSLLKMNLGRLEQDSECPQLIRQKLADLKGMADEVLDGLHRLAINLRPIALDHLGLVAALEQFAMKVHSNLCSVQFKALGFDGDRLPKDLETCLYRIVQEALANVIRHSRASNVGILLERRQGKVKLFVEDDGIGFDPSLSDDNKRLGLVGMRERAEMFEGTLTIESIPGKGTSIVVEVPDEHTNPYRG